jgi:hypothetical protein
MWNFKEGADFAIHDPFSVAEVRWANFSWRSGQFFVCVQTGVCEECNICCYLLDVLLCLVCLSNDAWWDLGMREATN